MGVGKLVNKLCACGSGKKFKKCCMSKEVDIPSYDKHYFRIKGENAEKLVNELATKSFFIDWCYLNPKFPSGKELCDLLIVFDDSVIIWQIKDLKLGDDNKYSKSEVEKNLKQLSGAHRQLFDLKTPIKLNNPRRGGELFEPKNIKKVYLISALTGEGEEYSTGFQYIKGRPVHIWSRQFIEKVLNELDTISDFTKYLGVLEDFHEDKKHVVIMGGYEELLAHYIMNGRNFNAFKKADHILIDGGSWDYLIKQPEYIAKNEADKISYGWDSIIDRVHECSPKYEVIAKELARLDRFQRRIMSKAFVDAKFIASRKHDASMMRRMMVMENVVYCLLFMDDPEPREHRKAMLSAMCFIARGLNKDSKKVIGIATEKKLSRTCSYDFCLIDQPNWTTKDQQKMERLQKETEIFTNPTRKVVHEDEFPEQINTASE